MRLLQHTGRAAVDVSIDDFYLRFQVRWQGHRFTIFRIAITRKPNAACHRTCRSHTVSPVLFSIRWSASLFSLMPKVDNRNGCVLCAGPAPAGGRQPGQPFAASARQRWHPRHRAGACHPCGADISNSRRLRGAQQLQAHLRQQCDPSICMSAARTDELPPMKVAHAVGCRCPSRGMTRLRRPARATAPRRQAANQQAACSARTGMQQMHPPQQLSLSS